MRTASSFRALRRSWGFHSTSRGSGRIFSNLVPAAKTAMRKARYGYLTHLSVQLSSPVVFLGHNFEDNVETVLMHFLRGSNLKGLSGIPEVRSGRLSRTDGTHNIHFVRPLLHTRREEIEGYLSALDLESREDSSNRENRYRRNWIRNQASSLHTGEL
ncbi:MAG: tRNA lysidine(34) synthetase TilS [Planctomycetota bacterium]|nr:tRNA lysidine(34) synthetase TilS [Planctomycetota bacterium]